jgi:hypothetical protein
LDVERACLEDVEDYWTRDAWGTRLEIPWSVGWELSFDQVRKN